MKRINSYILTGGVIILGLCGCTSNFDDYNKDPNRAEVGKANSSQMLEDLIFEGAGSMKYRTWRHNNEFMQYTVETSTLNQLHRFVLTDSEFKGAWNFCGRWAVNAIEMYELAEKEENTNAQAIALTMKALYLSNMTDLFGDMPFKEAFKGIDENIMQPKFDDQKVIYDSLLMDLERANTLYTKTSTIDAKRDLLYNGDVTKWRKFTNSLYLRLLMRVSNRRDMNSAERIKTVFENPSQYPIFESNDDNATLKYSGTRPFVNDFGDNATDDSAMGERFINIMVDSSDPRISVYCNRVSSGANAGGYVGITSGAPASVISKQSADGASNSNNTTFRQYTSPYTFMTYSEVLFIKAEAIQRGMMDGEASETYYAAVTASLKQWIPDISASAVETFLQNGAVAYDATTEIIITQKYVSLFTVGYESWHEYRRTGYPLLVMGEAIRNDGVHPTRFPYPLVLRSSNKNYATQLAKMGEDNMKTPVWWSRKAVKLENPEEDNNLGYTGHKWDADIKW